MLESEVRSLPRTGLEDSFFSVFYRLAHVLVNCKANVNPSQWARIRVVSRADHGQVGAARCDHVKSATCLDMKGDDNRL